MGYKIETYSLNELNRISTPGKVVPALFWMIPIGQWESNVLEKYGIILQKVGLCVMI